MKILSLFDGISCGRIALERANITVDSYYASEIDKHAIKISNKNYPDIIRLGDVNNIDFNELEGKIDLIIGGSPCQDLSIAKKNRQGLDGKASGLFWKFVEAINIIKPKYFLLENVASMSKENRDIITKTLGVEPILINSALVSAQRRKRLYWCNWQNTQPKDKEIYVKDILESGISWRPKSFCLTASYNRATFPHDFLRYQNLMIAELTNEPLRIGDLERSNQGYCIYSIKGKSICLSANSGGIGSNTGLYKIDLPDGDYIFRKLTPLECERLQTLPEGYTEGIRPQQRYKCIGNGWTVDVITHLLNNIKL